MTAGFGKDKDEFKKTRKGMSGFVVFNIDRKVNMVNSELTEADSLWWLLLTVIECTCTGHTLSGTVEPGTTYLLILLEDLTVCLKIFPVKTKNLTVCFQ